MLWAIIKKEFLSQVLRSQFIFSTAIILTLVILGVGMLIEDYEEENNELKGAQSIHRERMDEEENIWNVLHSYQVERPLSPLKPIATGSERDADIAIRLGPQGVTGTAGAFHRNPIYALFARIDLVFIIGVFLSLMVFVLSYDSISGEKEDGTLRLIFSYDVPRDLFLFGKWLGGVVSVSLPVLAGFAAAALMIVLSSAVEFGVEEWLGFVGILGVSFLYIAMMYTVGLFVSARSDRSSTSISVLLFVWVVFILILPNAMPYVAALVQQIESPARIQENLATASARLQQEFWGEVRKKADEMGWWNDDMMEWFEERRRQLQDDIAMSREEILGPYRREKAQFARVAMTLSRTSPLAAYTYAATRFAQTGPSQDDRVREAVERVREGLARVEVEVSSTRGHRRGSRQDQDPFFDRLPRLQFDWETPRDRLAGAALDCALLLAASVMCFLGAYVSFLRKDLGS